MWYSTLMRIAVLGIASWLLPLEGAEQPAPSSIPPEVYRAAGLDKLTGAEREALIEWINAGAPMVPGTPAPVVSSAPIASAAPVASPQPAALPTPLTPLSEKSEINTRILPPFTGWTGRTIFTMENGQVWQQRMDGNYAFKGADTRVIITREAFGLDRMRLVESGRWIGVKRIK
ncbi:MAG: hypothetical protein FJ178_02260 [Gammaproteobacteria bacterium]|nr:hypothetical protein [Gammaproteobacteria bacterium]